MNHTIAHLFSDHLATALSSTLIHSLWQGALLSAVTGLVMTCTRRSSSALRYNWLVAVMALFAVVVAGTFIIEVNKDGTGAPVSAVHYTVNQTPAPAGITVYTAASSSNIIETIGSYLNRYAATIVWIWFLIVCARCVQLLVGLRDVYDLRHKNTFGIGGYWEERVRQLGIQMGIKRRVGIRESGRTKIPMVTGHLKPLILIPISMLTSLSVEEAEAILLHELAHIRRADYLVNLLQSLMEIIFFFNPAVLWLSALIKAERENCCDDMVLARSSKVNYLKALLACEEYNQPSPAYAMALKGSNGGLKNRVARIISNKNLSLSGKEKSLLAACLIATGIFTAAFTNGVELNHQVTAASKTTQANFKSDAEKTRSIISDMMQDGIITSANDLSFKIGRDEFVVNYQKQPEDIYQKYRAKYVGDQPDGDRIWYYGFDKDKYKPAGNNYKASAVAKTDSDRVKNIISDLMNDGIITSLDGLSFKIGTDEFVVNYQKQPDAVYQKYRVKYVATQYSGSEDWIWYYNFDTPKWALIVAHKYKVEENTNHTQPDNATTGVFQGKLN
jgi:beta-lactamase regulating signal transducer with metallopeptidase domain